MVSNSLAGDAALLSSAGLVIAYNVKSEWCSSNGSEWLQKGKRAVMPGGYYRTDRRMAITVIAPSLV